MTLPTRAEFDRARSTPRAYVLVGPTHLQWVLRPVYVPPRPTVSAYRRLRRMAGRFASQVVAERMLASAVADARAEWREWVRRG